MVVTLLVASLLAAGPTAAPESADLAAYREARDRAGKEPGAQVRLALWCEQHGLTEQRARHLALALVADPLVLLWQRDARPQLARPPAD